MSLFQSRDWWVAQPDTEEEFDRGCMCLANIDNEPEGPAKVITGSYQGVLRVYYPRQAGYRVEDLMLEQRLGQPILQVLAGHFSSAVPDTLLAVLHPRKLVVLAVRAEGGTGKAARYYSLNKVYEHVLGIEGQHFTAYNMVSGSFGGVYGREFLCVQSMDGQLAFFEQERYAFTRQLPNTLVPAPLCYSEKTDCLITCSSDMFVEAYKYHALAAATAATPAAAAAADGAAAIAGAAAPAAASSSSAGVKQLRPDWRVNVGEHAVQIFTGRFSRALPSAQVDVIVLGEHTLFCLKETGGVRLQKRLDYNAAACCVYNRPTPDVGGSTQNLLVGTHTQQLLVYRDTQLLWSSRMDHCPTHMAVGQFGDLLGLVVTLSERGKVTLSYLGTDPPTNAVGAGDSKELNYEEMDEEHRKLLAVIRESQSSSRMEPRDRMLLRAQVPLRVETVAAEEEGEDAGVEAVPAEVRHHLARGPGGMLLRVSVRLFVSYTGGDPVEDVHLSLHVPPAIHVRETSMVLPSVAGGARTPLIVPLVFWPVTNEGCPSSLRVTAAATFVTPSGEPRTAQTVFDLPLAMACRLVPPLKNSAFKFTLDTNRGAIQLASLFGDLFDQPGVTEDTVARVASVGGNVLSFTYFNGEDCTVLASKSGGRYRMQGSALEALWLVSSELVRRMHNLAGSAVAEGGPAFAVTFQEPLPLADFFACIDAHFAARQRLAQLSAQLDDRAHQFRVIQKRLLVRFKDRNPAPLNHLDALLRGTHEQLQSLADEVAVQQRLLRECSAKLSAVVRLVLMLLRFRFALDEANYGVLESHLSPMVDDNAEQGWEERTDAAMTHLLRTVLARSARESVAAGPAALMAMPEDTTKLKKHITIVCDRLAKGAKLVLPPSDATRERREESKARRIAAAIATPAAPPSDSSPPADDEAAQ